MKYPKQVMKISELTKMGFAKSELLEIARSRSINKNHAIAWQKNASKSNSPYYFDTEELEKYRKSKCTGL